MNTDNSSPEKNTGKPGDKAKQSPDPKLNRDINKRVQDERFPEAILAKNPRKDTEKEARSQESDVRRSEGRE